MKKSLLAVVVALAAVSTSQAFSLGSDANGNAKLGVELRDKVTVSQKTDTVSADGKNALVNFKNFEVKNEVRGRLNGTATTKVDGLQLDLAGRLEFKAVQSKSRKYDAEYDLAKLLTAEDANKALEALNYTTSNSVTAKPDVTFLRVRATTDFGFLEAGYANYGGAGDLSTFGDQGVGLKDDTAKHAVTYFSPKFGDLSVGVTAGVSDYTAEGALVYTGLTNNKLELRGGYNFAKKSAWGGLQHFGDNLGVEGLGVTNLLGGYYSEGHQEASYTLGLKFKLPVVEVGAFGKVAYLFKTEGLTAKDALYFAATEEDKFDSDVLKKVNEVAAFGLAAPNNGEKTTVGYRVSAESKSASQKGLTYDLGAYATATLYKQGDFSLKATLAYKFSGKELTSDKTAEGLTYTLAKVDKVATDDAAKVAAKDAASFKPVEVTAQTNGAPANAEAGKALVNPVKVEALELKTSSKAHEAYFYLTATF